MKKALVLITGLFFFSAINVFEALSISNVTIADTTNASVTIPLPLIRLSPRPVSVAGVKIPTVDLNGVWLAKENPEAGFYKTPVTGTNGWKEVTIPRPMPWPDTHRTNGYQRSFSVPADWAGKRIKLRCDSAQGLATAWVNGQPIGQHDGSYAAFELDMTGQTKVKETNTLFVSVVPSTLAGFSQDPQGGIRRKVYLLALPEINVAMLNIDTTFDKAYRDATLNITAKIANESARKADGLKLRFALSGPDGERVKISPSDAAFQQIAAGESAEQLIMIPVPAPKQWDPEHPNLYVLTVELVQGRKVLEKVAQRFGFRQVEVRGSQLILNNRPFKLRGMMLAAWDPLSGWGKLTEELMRKDRESMLQMNMNLCYPNPTPEEELLDMCDEAGLAVIAMVRQTWTQATVSNAPLFIVQASDIVTFHRNHPSVIIWSMGNESAWGPAFEAMAKTFRQLDPSRPVMLAGSGSPAGFVQITSQHYPFPLKSGDVHDNTGRPIIFTEYAHVSFHNNFECLLDPSVRDYWGRELNTLWESFYNHKLAAGASIFCGLDCIGYDWGMLDKWHRQKAECWQTRKVYSPVRIFEKFVRPPAAGEPLRVEVHNRHFFSNLSEIKIEWTIGDRKGTVKADIPPGAKGILEIPFTPRSGGTQEELGLTFTNPRGRVFDEYLLPIGERTVVRPAPVTIEKPSVKRDDAKITVNAAGGVTWEFDAKTGAILAGRKAGKDLVVGGPVLALTVAGAYATGLYTNWLATKVDVKEEGGIVEVQAAGKYDQVTGSYTMQVAGNGELTVRYAFESIVLGTNTVLIREVGLSFDVARTCDLLSWRRDGMWTVYPQDHIGRVTGSAPAFRDEKWPQVKPDDEPPWPWSLDSMDTGTRDFRSTKHNIYEATLKDKEGSGVRVDSDGKQHVRVAVQGKIIRLLVKDYSGGGYNVYSAVVKYENMKIDKDSKVEGTVRLALMP